MKNKTEILIAWNPKTKRFYKKGVGKNTVVTTTIESEAFVFQKKMYLKSFLKDHPKFEQYAKI